MADANELALIAERWEGTAKGFRDLTFEEATADMQALLAEAREAKKLRERISELEAHVRKRNGDMQAFAAEVNRLATQKYSDYMDLGKDVRP